MPYPLPEEGPPYTAGLRWFLVAVPDDVAFVRAALGAYTEFTHFWKWGREGKEPGRSEAAQAWEAAVAATLEALEMGFPDILLGILRQIRDRPCCGSGATDTIPNPGEGGGGIAPVGTDDQVPDYTDDTDIVANPPQTSFTDADEDAETTGPEMVEYLCAAAHWYYDLLHRWLSFMKLYSTLGGLVWDPVSAIINLVVSRYGGSNPIATMAVEVADQLVNLWPEVNAAIVDAIIVELEANRDDIICAIAVERNLAGMISAAYSQLQTITTALGYLNMLPMVSYPVFAMALVSQGLIDLSDVEGSCDCPDVVSSVLYGFDIDSEGWSRYSLPGLAPLSNEWYAGEGNPPGSLHYASVSSLWISPVINAAQHDQIRVTSEWYRPGTGAARTPVIELRDEAFALIGALELAGQSQESWLERVCTFDHEGSGNIRVCARTQGGDLLVDNVFIEFLQDS